MLIESGWISAEWPRLLDDAGVSVERAQLIVVRDRRPIGATECAYCAPSMTPPLPAGTNAVIRRIDLDRLAQHHHIVGVWQELPEADEISTSALLRHEVEHARQWEQYGPQLLDELDAELKTVAAAVGRSYHSAPVERAADDAARAWIESRYGAAEAARLAEVFPHWQEAPVGARKASLHEETVGALRAWAPDRYMVTMSGNPAIPLEDFIQGNSGDLPGLQAGERREAEPIEFVE